VTVIAGAPPGRQVHVVASTGAGEVLVGAEAAAQRDETRVRPLRDAARDDARMSLGAHLEEIGEEPDALDVQLGETPERGAAGGAPGPAGSFPCGSPRVRLAQRGEVLASPRRRLVGLDLVEAG
jgi:hypothetical protein